jgi:hypothetical protein
VNCTSTLPMIFWPIYFVNQNLLDFNPLNQHVSFTTDAFQNKVYHSSWDSEVEFFIVKSEGLALKSFVSVILVNIAYLPSNSPCLLWKDLNVLLVLNTCLEHKKRYMWASDFCSCNFNVNSWFGLVWTPLRVKEVEHDNFEMGSRSFRTL